MNLLNTVLNRLEEFIVSVALVISVLLTFIEVVLRYGFGSSLGFTHELVVYLLILTGLVGASVGVRKKVHLGVDLLIKQFPVIVQKMILIVVAFTSALFCLLIMILGIQHVQILIEFGQLSPEMEIPMYFPKSIIPIAFGLMTFRYLQDTYRFIKMPADKVLLQEEGAQS